jgi:anti-sigma B factor antagonist
MIKPSPFELRCEVSGDSVRIFVAGELDMATVPRLEQEVEARLPDGPCELLLELSGLTFIDSSGLRLLIMLAERAKAEGWTLSITRPPERTLTIFEISGVGKYLPLLKDPGLAR